MATAETIALVIINEVSDTSFILEVLDPIKGCDKNEEFRVLLFESLNHTVPRGFREFVRGDTVLVYSSYGYVEGSGSEGIVPFQNDTLMFMKSAFRHGCFSQKYGTINRYGNNPRGYYQFEYDEFKQALVDLNKHRPKLLKKMPRDRSVRMTNKKDGLGYNPREGTVPKLNKPYLRHFRGKSESHEFLLNELIDVELTTSYNRGTWFLWKWWYFGF